MSSPDTVSDTFAVGSNEYSLCILWQLAYFCLSIHTYSHLPSSDTASDTVCRWLDRVVYLQLQTVSLLAFNNPQIHLLAINISDSVCRWLDQAFSLQSLGRLVSSESLFTHMLTCHRPTRYVTVFAVGSIEYVVCSFRQLAYVRLAIHEFTHLPSPDTVSYWVCR